MNASATLARRDSSALVPVEGGYAFGHSQTPISVADAAAISAYAEPRGAALVRTDDRFWFVVPKLIADAQPDFAGVLLCDLQNAGLLVADYRAA